MSDDPSKEELAETMQVVENQINRMIKLVDDLFAMYELREYDLSEVITVNEVIREVIAEQAGNRPIPAQRSEELRFTISVPRMTP